MNLDGSNQVQLTPDSLMADYPAWSPDGLKLAFVAHNGDYQYGIWLIDRNGGGLVRIASSSGAPVAWRPR
jgi:Tol biopolymer transport system component